MYFNYSRGMKGKQGENGKKYRNVGKSAYFREGMSGEYE